MSTRRLEDCFVCSVFTYFGIWAGVWLYSTLNGVIYTFWNQWPTRTGSNPNHKKRSTIVAAIFPESCLAYLNELIEGKQPARPLLIEGFTACMLAGHGFQNNRIYLLKISHKGYSSAVDCFVDTIGHKSSSSPRQIESKNKSIKITNTCKIS